MKKREEKGEERRKERRGETAKANRRVVREREMKKIKQQKTRG